ncbi:leucyl aminopeptidase family protein [Mongoliitalea daihaiensis]|uniref:leucyl aminopeptidase family protein n=1 Tax=Mongoliitalea daihaiensis TaxID=2782006 RepID=UPI001F2F12B1|nr:leucyl aminopeptidase family protein [Mongoliitalea daihaiensis]UJP63491.1 leucyl aminopeptidase family protein [Mongoliitalea daihaiensis]
MKFSIYLETAKSVSNTIIIPCVEADSIRYSWNDQSLELKSSLFTGKKDTVYSLVQDGRLFIFVGLGSSPEFKTIQNSFRRLTAKQSSLLEGEIVLDLSNFSEDWFLEAAVSGLKLGSYRLSHFKTDDLGSNHLDMVSFVCLSNISQTEEAIDRGEKIAHAQLETFKLVDLPANTVTPQYLADWANRMGAQYNVAVEVFDEHQALEKGLHAFLAVGRASNRPPRFIILDYVPENPEKHIGLVGKGVTFDTGGLNIKTQGMVHMKCDMGGAATVLGAMQLAASLKVPHRLTAIVPCVENAIDSNAYLPSDVIGSYSGKTIEVIDTDAEGRLILADGLSYMVKNYAPEILIDFATLTGSTVGTFGYSCAALFSKNDSLVKDLQKAGDAVGERMWPLPMWDSYQSEMDSEIADIKNYHGKPFAGAITAAKFLEFFTEKHPAYAHIDIAGTAFGDSEFAKTKHATAYGVHLFLKLLENL